MATKPYTREGMPVIDAKSDLKIQITKADIGRADAKDPARCAAAIALKRGHFQDAEVHLGRVFVRSNRGNWQRYVTPKSLRDELIAFDRGGTFEAGEYTLLAPLPSQRLRHKPTGPKKKKGKKRRPRHVIKNVRPVA